MVKANRNAGKQPGIKNSIYVYENLISIFDLKLINLLDFHSLNPMKDVKNFIYYIFLSCTIKLALVPSTETDQPCIGCPLYVMHSPLAAAHVCCPKLLHGKPGQCGNPVLL